MRHLQLQPVIFFPGQYDPCNNIKYKCSGKNNSVAGNYRAYRCCYYTDYRKKTKGGIMGHRYQNLKDVLDVAKLPGDEEIAKLLRNKEWE